MKFFLLLLLIETMTCLCNSPFVVELIQGFGFGLLFPLIIFQILSMFFAFKNGKASFIFKTSFVLPTVLEACVYEIFLALLFITGFVGLKYLEISFTSFSNLAGIREEILLILVGLSATFSSFLSFFSKFTLRVNLKATFCLKLVLYLSAMNGFYTEL